MSTNILDKIGSVGAVIAGVAVPCCFPFLSLIGSILGLSFLAPYETYVLYAMQVLVVVALIGSIIAYRNHRKILPLMIGVLSTAAVLYSLNTDMDIKLVYGGLAGLIVVAVWNSIEAKRCATACSTRKSIDNEEEMKEKGKNIFLGSAFIAALASSLCCILPVVAIVLGVGAFGIASIFETLRPYLLIVVVFALAFSFYQTYFRHEKCDEGEVCARKPIGRMNQTILWTATIAIIFFALFPYYTGYIVSALDKGQQPTVENSLQDTAIGNNDETSAIAVESQTRKTVLISVEGMTCEDCATHLNIALKRIKGVISAVASYRDKNVKVIYNPKQAGIDRIRQGISDAGYDPQ